MIRVTVRVRIRVRVRDRVAWGTIRGHVGFIRTHLECCCYFSFRAFIKELCTPNHRCGLGLGFINRDCVTVRVRS